MPSHRPRPPPRVLRFTALLAALLTPWGPLRAADGSDPTQSDAEVVRDPPAKISAGGNLVIAPIPISNPSVGSGLALTGMWLYKVDAQSPESSTAFGGGYLSSGTWLAGAGQKLNFDADHSAGRGRRPRADQLHVLRRGR